MYGFDAYIHLQYVDSILVNQHIIELDIAKSYYDFIGFHVFASALSALTGLKPSVIFEFVSIMIPILMIALVYMISKLITTVKKIKYKQKTIRDRW